MIEIKLAYRHDNNECEGFTGTSFTNESKARNDAFSQIHKKLAIISELEGTPRLFDKNRVIESKEGLTKDEIAGIECDWRVNKRY
jgi:hypothetical protein